MIIEPFRIKVIEPLPIVSRPVRRRALQSAGYNPFQIPARAVIFDLISDSGTSAMSLHQWTALFQAREDFSGQEAYRVYVETAQRITGFPFIQPVHQGRAAEKLLFDLLLKPGTTTIANAHFETTRENIKAAGGKPLDLPGPEPPYNGNIDLMRLVRIIRSRSRIGLLIMTMTSNVYGGQAVSLDNLRQARRLARRRQIPVVIDASRWADNAYLIRDYSRSKLSISAIGRELFRHADMVFFSNKKDGLANIGGSICLRDQSLFERVQREIIRQESYPSSGGLAARDLAAMAEGLKESINLNYLRSHITAIRYLGQSLKKRGVSIYEPIGGHAVVVLPHSGPHGSFALAARIYLEAGIRVGVFDQSVRLALPRRVYTFRQLEWIADQIAIAFHRPAFRLKPVNRPASFYNFFVRFKNY